MRDLRINGDAAEQVRHMRLLNHTAVLCKPCREQLSLLIEALSQGFFALRWQNILQALFQGP